jgi:hypothetical protein
MHRAAMSEVRLFNWLRDGRGQGFGKDYLPLLQVTRQDHASIGQSHIIPNQFIGRQHHLLSTLERKACLLNLAQRSVKDLREQYPHWPCFHESPLMSLYAYLNLDWPAAHPSDSEGTLAIAKQLGLRHAKFVGLKIPYIYTTDQLVTIELPGQPPMLVALCVKYRSDLRPKKVRCKMFRKLRLEREYWRSLDIPWLLVTERSINEQVYLNLEFALSGAIQRVQPGDVTLLNQFVLAFGAAEWGGRCLDQMIAISRVLGVNVESTIRALKLAIWKALIPVDLTHPVDLQIPLTQLRGRRPSIDSWSPLSKLGKSHV